MDTKELRLHSDLDDSSVSQSPLSGSRPLKRFSFLASPKRKPLARSPLNSPKSNSETDHNMLPFPKRRKKDHHTDNIMRNAQAEHEAKMEILKLKKELYLLKFLTLMTRARPGPAVDVVSSFTSF